LLPAEVHYSPIEQWQQFGLQHLVVLGIALIGCVNLLVFRNELRGRRVDVWLVGAMLTVHLVWIAAALGSGFAEAGDLLPLYTCDASIVAGIFWCWRKPRWLGQVIFYWAFLGGVVTLLLPDTFGYALPHFAVVYTLLFHILLLLFGLSVWAVEGVPPTWRSLVPLVLVTSALVPPSLVANAAFGSDYMFVSRNPGGIFTFLNDFDGWVRVVVNLASAFALGMAGLLMWFAMDMLLRGPRRVEVPNAYDSVHLRRPRRMLAAIACERRSSSSRGRRSNLSG
jgi:hypothetical integral membrane protein (TIGR02206 family)